MTAKSAGVFSDISISASIQHSNLTHDQMAAEAADLMLQLADSTSVVQTAVFSQYITEIALLVPRDFLKADEVGGLHMLTEYENSASDMETLARYKRDRKIDCDVVRKANQSYAEPKTKDTKDARSGFTGTFGDQLMFFGGLH